MPNRILTTKQRLELDIKWATREHSQAETLVKHFRGVIEAAQKADDWRREMLGQLNYELAVAEKSELLRRANLERLRTKQAGQQ